MKDLTRNWGFRSAIIILCNLTLPYLSIGEPLNIVCTPDLFPPNKHHMDGCGYEFREGTFQELSSSQVGAWSKMRIQLKSDSSAQLEIYYSEPPTEQDKYVVTGRVLSSDNQRVTLFYERNFDDKEHGPERQSWLLTYFPPTNILYSSLHTFDSMYSQKLAAAPFVRAYLLKAQCSPAK